MHLNRQLLLGRISKSPELRYNAKGTPYCTLTLAVNKPGRDDGQVYTSWHQVEITGRFAEDLSVTLEAGDEILVEGEHQHRSLVDPKTAEKKKWCVLSTWGIIQKESHASSPVATTFSETDSAGPVDVGLNHGHSEAPEPVSHPKVRKRALPKLAQQEWEPAHSN